MRSTKLLATTDGERRRRRSMQSHKGGTWIAFFVTVSLQSCNRIEVTTEVTSPNREGHGNSGSFEIKGSLQFRSIGSQPNSSLPALFTQREEIDIDFRVSGLPHAVVKQAENSRVRELVKKIEGHPHREALQADLPQNNAYDTFGDESKAMIREMGNVEFFELCETIPKVQCSERLLYWNLLVESESSQHFHQWRLDAFSIPHHVNKKGRPRGARHCKTEAQKQHFLAHNARRRCIKKNFDGIHDRFQRDSVFRDSQLKIGWTEEKCIEMDKLAQEDHSYCPSSEEYERYKKNGYISLNKSGRNAPRKLRSDFREAFTNMHRLHRGSGEERPEPIPVHQYQRHSSSSSSSTSWWQWNENWWSSYFSFFAARTFTADGNRLQPMGGVNRTPSHVTFSSVSLHS